MSKIEQRPGMNGFKREPSLYGMIATARNDWLWRHHDRRLLLIKFLRANHVDFFNLQARKRKERKTTDTFDLLKYIEKAYLNSRQRDVIKVAIDPASYLILLAKFLQNILKSNKTKTEMIKKW